IVESGVKSQGSGVGVPAATRTGDPLLGTFQDNGGPTQTLRPTGSSAAIGNGLGSICTGAQVGSVDQRGATRTMTCANRAFEPVTLNASGTACTLNSQCATLRCIDGFCCDIACGGGDTTDCQSCRASQTAGANGTCLPISSGTVCRAAVIG